jgi:predicted Fe-Mo cluster-binding NifX family protein
MIKLAVPTRDNKVDDHFGNCEAYNIFTIDASNKIEKQEIMPSTQGCGCKSNIGKILKEKGVTIMLAGNMGDGAFKVLKHHGMEVYRGCSGEVSLLVEAFLQGKINDSGDSCKSHDDHDHDHDHHHHHDHDHGHDHVCNHHSH